VDHEGIAGFRALGYMARPPAPAGGTVATRDTLRHAANVLAEAGGRPLQGYRTRSSCDGWPTRRPAARPQRRHPAHQTLRCLSPLPGLL